jgi:predicted O-methyltransferase YrrM
MLIRMLRYYFRARTRYDIHSPFVFQLIEEVLEDDRNYYAFSEIEYLRWRLKKNTTKITITDYGAGSRVNSSSQRKISSIAKHSAISPATGRLLFRLLNFLQPDSTLELGTSLGISTSYLKSARRQSHMITIEGCPAVAREAAQNLNTFKFKQLTLLTGSFQEMLPVALLDIGRLDCLYLDGDHRKDASLKYFEACLEKAHENSFFIIADIHWSGEMEAAWEQMKAHPEVTLTIDLYHVGLIFFRKQSKGESHYTLIKAKYKPWRMGFFSSGQP